MTDEEYLNFLKTAPEDQCSNEFIKFLLENNEVREKFGNWVIIKNKKRWTPESDWLTAFYIGAKNEIESQIYGLKELHNLYHYKDREWKIHHPIKRTIKLFHVHLYHITK